MLRCRDGSLYTGITNNLPKRLQAHVAGKASKYTRSRLPVALAYTIPQPTKSRALKREAAIKRLRRVEKERLITTGGRSSPGKSGRSTLSPLPVPTSAPSAGRQRP
ncbi:MAG: GIY-YIG nuclease family protein [Pirellulales bacterium]